MVPVAMRIFPFTAINVFFTTIYSLSFPLIVIATEHKIPPGTGKLPSLLRAAWRPRGRNSNFPSLISQGTKSQ